MASTITDSSAYCSNGTSLTSRRRRRQVEVVWRCPSQPAGLDRRVCCFIGPVQESYTQQSSAPLEHNDRATQLLDVHFLDEEAALRQRRIRERRRRLTRR